MTTNTTRNRAAAQRRIGGVRVTPGRVVAAILTILAVWFVLINRNMVKIHLWGIATVNAPMWLVLLVMLLVGCLIGILVQRRRQARRHA